MRPRYAVAVVAVLVLGLLAVGAVALTASDGGGDNDEAVTGTVESASLAVTYTDPDTVDLDGREGEVTSCIAAGTPPGFYAVRVRATVGNLTADPSTSYALNVTLDGRTVERFDGVGDRRRWHVEQLLTTEADPNAAVGVELPATVSLFADGELVDSLERTVTVAEGTYECVDGT